ncbi:response regulator transcription factor [Streptococcus infantis]|uniref:response regulator transcription factor n=1 Tax=Streptococcus infantis TaxID=68892 RepID=UPI0039C12B9E
MKILIVEDEDMIREGISDYLTNCGYETIQAADGLEALEQFSNHQVALILLDIQMPKLNGLEVLSEIRKSSQVPVLMLTAFQDEEYKMSAFAALADGYLEKPFSLSLLKVRVDAIFKRYYDTGRIFTYRDTEVDFDSYSAKVAGQEVAVNAKELEILDYLVRNEGRALTRSQIIDAVWKMTDEVPFDRVIDVYIKELRKKLDLDCILTVRNVGYKLERK